MKKSVKFIITLLIILLLALCFNNSNVYASISMSASSITVNAGEEETVTMSANNSTGNVQISSSNPEVATAVASADSISDNTVTITVTGKSRGTATITISGVARNTDTGANQANYSRTITVNVEGTASSETTSTSANLINLGITPNDFSGFSPDKTTYDVTVPEDTQTIEIYATAANAGAKISGTGTQELAIGANTFNVVVTGTDDQTKTYTLNITRGNGNTENTGSTAENTEVKEGLSSLNIENLELDPKFSTDVYEYKVKYVGDKAQLDINPVVTSPDYTTEIVGNENLQEGENTITILVSDSEGKNIATYQVTVNKMLVDEEAIAREEAEKKKQEQQKMFLIAGGIVAVILIIVIVIIIRNRRKRAYAEEFSGIPFANMNNDDDYSNDDYFNNNYNDDTDDEVQNEFRPALSMKKEEQELNNNEQENAQDNDMGIKQNDEDTDNVEEKQNLNLNTNKTEDDIEKVKKEELRRQFLDGYNSNDDIEERIRKNRHKGKRFK